MSGRVNYRLNDVQRQELRMEINKFSQDGHYGAAYRYLYNNVPHDDYHGNTPAYSNENAGIKTWFGVAASTNSQSGDVIDSTLRSLTREVMNQRGIGDEYSEQKYNKFSNDMADKLLNEIAKTGEVSREKILNADADNFTNFGSNGEIKRGDWPGSIIDNALLGGDVVNASNDIDWESLTKGTHNGLGDFFDKLFDDMGDWLLPKLLDLSDVLSKP